MPWEMILYQDDIIHVTYCIGLADDAKEMDKEVRHAFERQGVRVGSSTGIRTQADPFPMQVIVFRPGNRPS